MKFRMDLVGIDQLESELARLNSFNLRAIQKKQVTEALNRARAPGGTPVDTGELRQSVGADPEAGIIGYTKDYAPHVEYGHRTVDGGYVQGQHFLQKNVERQREIYKTDIRRALRNERNAGE